LGEKQIKGRMSNINDKKYERWFDVNPMLWVDLERWQQAKE
jgi:hypothetical protein